MDEEIGESKEEEVCLKLFNDRYFLLLGHIACMHTVPIMWSISTDVTRSVVCLSVCHLDVLCKKAEWIKMPFGGVTLSGTRNCVLDGGRDHPMGSGSRLRISAVVYAAKGSFGQQ